MAHEQLQSSARWNDLVAEEIMTRWEASGLSCRAFCATHGVSLKRLYRWRRRLRPRTRSPSGERAPPSGFALAVPSPGVRVRVACGAQIEVDPGFDAHLLRQVLAALC